MDHIFIYADMDSLAVVAEGDITGIEVDECQTMDDFRSLVKRMSTEDRERLPFERLLKVPTELMGTIHQEYWIEL